MEKETRNKLLLTAVYVVIGIIGAAVFFYFMEHRNDKIYDAMEKQGFENFEPADTVSEVDTVQLDSAMVDTVDITKYEFSREFRKRADLVKDILADMNCLINRVDTEYNEITFWFVYVGENSNENMHIVVSEASPMINIVDNAWYAVDADDKETVDAVKRVANGFNHIFPFKILHYKDEDNMVRVETSREILITWDTPNKSRYVTAVINNMLKVHEYFIGYLPEV